MARSDGARPGVVLSSADVTGGSQLLLHACEDCACAVSTTQGTGPLAAVANSDGDCWVAADGIVEMRLDPDHHLLFNPMGQAGVVVVDEAAYEVFRSFRVATPIRAMAAARSRDTAEAVVISRQLAQLQMIHDFEKPPCGPPFGNPSMLTAWLHVTNACNLRCPYCYVSKSSEGMSEETGRATVEAIVRSALTHGFAEIKLKYAGGEASLNHRLIAYIHNYAKEMSRLHGLRLHASLLTNGVALPPELVKTLIAERIGVMISLDGVGDQHDAQRPFANGRSSFKLVDRTIDSLREEGYPPHLSITITNRNAAGLAETVRFALERGLTFSFNLFRDNDCAAAFPDLRYEEKVITEAMIDAFAVIEQYLPAWSVLGCVLDRGQLLQPRQRSCGVGQDYVVIDQRGQVAKCHMEIERTIGDVFGSDPLDLVRADTTSALNLVVDEKEGCRDCAWRYWCSGGCTIATFRATGRYDVKSPNCNIYKAIYPHALRLEALRLLKYAAKA